VVISFQIAVAMILQILKIEITSIIRYELIFLMVFIPHGLQRPRSHLRHLAAMSWLLVDHIPCNTLHVQLDLARNSAALRGLG